MQKNLKMKMKFIFILPVFFYFFFWNFLGTKIFFKDFQEFMKTLEIFNNFVHFFSLWFHLWRRREQSVGSFMEENEKKFKTFYLFLNSTYLRKYIWNEKKEISEFESEFQSFKAKNVHCFATIHKAMQWKISSFFFWKLFKNLK